MQVVRLEVLLCGLNSSDYTQVTSIRSIMVVPENELLNASIFCHHGLVLAPPELAKVKQAISVYFVSEVSVQVAGSCEFCRRVIGLY